MLSVVAEEFSAWYAEAYPLAPKVEVTFVPESEGKSVSNLILDGPSGNGPDIIAFVHDTLGTAVNNGLLDPVPYASEITSKNTPESVSAFTFDDVLYAYPYVAESITVMYDSSKLQASDLTSFATLLASGQKMALATTGDGSAYYTFGLFSDAILFGADGTNSTDLNLATEQSVANVYSFLHNYSAAITDTDPDTALSLLGTGEVAAVVTSPYLWSSVKTNLGAHAALATLPMIDGVDQRPFSGFKGYGVSKYSKNPTIAHLFAHYLTTEDSQYYRFHEKGYLPTYVGSSRIDTAIASDPEASVFKASLEKSLAMPNILAMADYWSPMQDACTQLWNEKDMITPTEVQTILESATTTILS
ncbi:MAG: extracellular solute-binding protein, partial [Firmicutes bacterium]|nr:extracellular solute-binding protein [Bacillota bacterium]